MTFFQFSIICILAYISSYYNLIDLYLYQIFTKYELFPQVFASADWVNAQYTKLMLYLMVTPILGLLLCFRNQRNLDRIFVMLSCIAGMILTSVLHKYVINEYLIFNI